MAFIRIPGLTGRLFVPSPPAKGCAKRPCPDCFGCQQCSEARCGVCRGSCPSEKRPLEPDTGDRACDP